MTSFKPCSPRMPCSSRRPRKWTQAAASSLWASSQAKISERPVSGQKPIAIRSGRLCPFLTLRRRCLLSSLVSPVVSSCVNQMASICKIGGTWVASRSGLIRLGPWSVHPLRVQYVEQRLVCEEAAQIFAEEIGDAAVLAVASAGRMRGDQHVGHVPEWAVRGQRLDLDDVQRSPAQMPTTQRCDQRRFIHDLTAANVDEQSACR